MNIEQFGKGALRDSIDPKDYKYEEIMGAGEPFDWDMGYEIPYSLKVEHQGKSLSCVGQSWAYYAEELEQIESIKLTDLSAKDIYQRIFMPQGGAEIRRGASVIKNFGLNTEKDVPSYELEMPPSELFMRTFKSGDEEALNYIAKSYASVLPGSIDHIAQVIRDNSGCVSGFNGDNEGWATAFVKPPISAKWGHAVYLVGAELINGKKYIKFINSWGTGWGENGYGYFDESYLSNMFSLWTLIDQINPNNKKMEYVKSIMNEEYLVDKTLMIKLNIGDVPERAFLQARGLTGSPNLMSDIELARYEDYPLIRKTSVKTSIAKLRDQLGL